MRAIETCSIVDLVSRKGTPQPGLFIGSFWAARVPDGAISRILIVARGIYYAATLLSLASCAGQGVTKTGFLSSYDGMRPNEAHTEDLIYVGPAYSPTAYNSVVIDPVVWSPAPDTPQRDPEVIEELKSDFKKSLTEALAKNYKILDPAAGAMPSSGVLRIRSAITNTRRANWYLNVPSVALSELIFLPPIMPDPGGASEELEAVDTNTGKRVVAIATFNNGMPWNPLGGVQKFGHARRAFRKASELMQEQLEGNKSITKAGP